MTEQEAIFIFEQLVEHYGPIAFQQSGAMLTLSYVTHDEDGAGIQTIRASGGFMDLMRVAKILLR